MAKLNYVRRVFVSSLLAAAVAIVGCTRKSETTTMNVAMPDWAKLTAAQSQKSFSAQASAMEIAVVTRVMINITGADIPTQVLIWDIKDYNYNAGDPVPTPPASFSFSVARGANRMFQALAIVQQVDLSGSLSTDGKAMTFYYGDVTKSLTLSEDSVDILLADQGTSNGDEGSLSGRYVDASGNGPSGKLNMYFAPPNRPEMIVDTGSIYSGYFQLFLPSNLKFSFRTAAGTPLFTQVNIDSFDSNLNEGLVKIQVPAGFRDNGTGTRQSQGVRTRIAGFVGAGAAGKRVCYDSTPTNLANLYASASAANTTRVPWNPSGVSPSFARVLGGGYATSGGLCPNGSGDAGAGYFEVRTQLLPNGDSSVGSRGPFAELSPASNNFLSSSFAGTSLQLQWRYLRPTIGDSVGGVGVFTRTYTANETIPNRWSDSAPCSKLVSDYGFTEVTRVSAGTVATPVETYTITGIPVAAYTSGRFLTVVCPYAPSGGYYDFALMLQGNSGSQQQAATQLIVKRKLSELGNLAANPSSFASNTCTPMTVRTADANGNIAYRAGATGTPQVLVTLNGAVGDSYLYADPYCSTGQKGILLNSDGEQTFYLKLDGSVTTFDMTASDTTVGGTSLPSTTFYGVGSSSPSATKLVFAAANTINAFECTPVMFVRGAVVGAEFVPQPGIYGSLLHSADIAAYPGLNFYAYGDCATPTTASYFSSASQSSIAMYVKYTGPLAQIQIAPDASGVGLVTSPTIIPVVQPGPATQIRFSMPAIVNAESCVPVRLNVYDAAGKPAAMPAATNINFSYSQAPPALSGVFSDYYCMTPVSNQALAAGDSQSAQLYVRWTSPGAVTFGEAAFNGVVPVIPSVVNFTAAAVANIVARIPEVNWTFPGYSSYTGVGPQRNMGEIFGLVLEARSILGNLVTTFNQPDIFSSGLYLRDNFQEVPNCLSGAIFVNGVATLNCNISDDGQSPGYRVQFTTGGNPTTYPFNSTPDQFFMTKAGENASTFALNPGFKYTSGTCIPVMVQRRAGIDFATMATAPINIALTAVNGVAGFYTDGACTAATSIATIPALQSSALIYMLANGVSAPMMQADSATLFDPYLFYPSTATLGAPSAAAGYQITIFNAIKQGACEPVMFTRADSGGAPIAATAPLTLALGSANMNAQWFATGNCGGAPLSTATLATGESAKIVYIRAMQQTASGTVTVSDNDAPSHSGAAMNIQVLF